MSEPNIFDEIWDSYQVTLDCLKIAERSIKNSNDKDGRVLLKGTKFIELTDTKAKEKIDSSRKNVDDYVIFRLWIAFERSLFAFCINESKKLLNGTASDFTGNFQAEIANKIEYWRVDDVLDLFKPIIDAESLSQAKQVKKYRDWLAHKNENKPMPANILPQNAYRILSVIVEQLDSHPTTF